MFNTRENADAYAQIEGLKVTAWRVHCHPYTAGEDDEC